MTTEWHLATLDELCVRDFPATHGWSDVGAGGPGYHLVVLETTRGLGTGDDGSSREEIARRFAACREGVSRRLGERWGEAEPKSLDGVFLRSEDPGERIPKPWAYLSAYVRHVDLWKADDSGRWVAVGVSDPAEGPDLQLFALVTDLPPP
ncbi:hypothetical protein [Streptomyces beigongshangae]|uniref:hypothetical protein n=1 Tax=Streptomyces beigongshangae TaxID=2841597 RepID=UPI001C852B38|nr:hypothetical protein [Streptomyces sp. REN17]